MTTPLPFCRSGSLVLSLVLCFTIGTSARAQTPISAGQTITGRLEAGDAKLEDDTYFDFFAYQGQPGDRLVITMRSADFDTFLSGGPLNGSDLDVQDYDDDSAGGTDSRMEVIVGPSGRYGIRANSIFEDETGAYTLTVERVGGQAQGAPSGTGTIRAGQTISGRLEASDPRLSDGSYYDLYRYEGRAGDRIVITMRSDAFDTHLSWGRLAGSTFTADESDDDGAGGTDSRLTVTVGSGGSYGIRANSFDGDETGAYTLTVELVGGASAPAPGSAGAMEIAAGQTIHGRLDGSDPRLSDDSHYDLYVYRGSPGEEISITMRSSDFDTYLSGGSIRGGDFQAQDSDDDGAGGTDSRLIATLGTDGTYAIRANSYGGGETGSYTLEVTSSAANSSNSRTLRPGETRVARLESTDPRLSDNSHYDLYEYQGRAGETVVITLASQDFDAYLRWGRIRNGQFEFLRSDDDGGGGTNARLELVLAEDGLYGIQANSYSGDETGRYTLSLTSVGASTVAGATIGLGQTVNSRLDESDPVMSDNSYYELYTYRGRPGEQVVVTMRSPDFDTYLTTGRMVGDRFSSEQSDDDGAGGTDSRIEATVGPDGLLVIRANSLSARQTGRFTLEVASASAGGAPVATTAGFPSIAAGSRVSGVLRTADPMLADSSYYNQYVYSGTAGERIRIRLTSNEFDAYLRWGTLNGGEFRVTAYDDDSGGGTDAQLEVTLGSSGIYAIQANSYAPGETGSYTLAIEPLSAAAPSTPAPVTTTAGGGKWMYQYVDIPDPTYRSLGQQLKQVRALEEISDNLNSRFILPTNIDLRLDECQMVNAYYSPRDRDIVFCYELLEELAMIFGGSDGWTAEEQEAVQGAFRFIMMHEVGHALVHNLDLPITGREEDAADQLAVVTLVENSGDKGAEAALNGVLAIQPATNSFDDSEFADEHSLGPVRLYNVLCWIYGSNPSKYSGIVASGSLPQERAVRCPGEYERMSKAWQRILAPYTM